MEKGLNREKNRISLFFVESPDFFMGLQIFLYQGLAGLYRYVWSRFGHILAGFGHFGHK